MNNRPRLVFATNNAHKLDEIRHILGDRVEILSLNDIGCHDDIPEDEPTLEGNALAKARYIYERYGCDCFADDTGLEVTALDGAPGVHTARFAGPQCNPDDNMRLLLSRLNGVDDRSARFRTVIALIMDGHTTMFEGTVPGTIATEQCGDAGFGYDPIFIPSGQTLTYARLGDDFKNRYSHRAIASARLAEHLSLR